MECDSHCLVLCAHHRLSAHSRHPQFSSRNDWVEVNSSLLLVSLFKCYYLIGFLFVCLWILDLIWFSLIGIGFFSSFSTPFLTGYVCTSLCWSLSSWGRKYSLLINSAKAIFKTIWSTQVTSWFHFSSSLWVRNPFLCLTFVLRYFNFPSNCQFSL